MKMLGLLTIGKYNYEQVVFWSNKAKKARQTGTKCATFINLCMCVGMKGNNFSNYIKQLDRFRSLKNQKREVICNIPLEIFNCT